MEDRLLRTRPLLSYGKVLIYLYRWFLSLINSVTITIDHHYKNATAFANSVQLIRVLIPHGLLAGTCTGFRPWHSVYLPVAFFEEPSDKRFLLLVFAEDGDL